jgi:hypothetical protein
MLSTQNSSLSIGDLILIIPVIFRNVKEYKNNNVNNLTGDSLVARFAALAVAYGNCSAMQPG